MIRITTSRWRSRSPDPLSGRVPSGSRLGRPCPDRSGRGSLIAPLIGMSGGAGGPGFGIDAVSPAGAHRHSCSLEAVTRHLSEPELLELSQARNATAATLRSGITLRCFEEGPLPERDTAWLEMQVFVLPRASTRFVASFVVPVNRVAKLWTLPWKPRRHGGIPQCQCPVPCLGGRGLMSQCRVQPRPNCKVPERINVWHTAFV